MIISVNWNEVDPKTIKGHTFNHCMSDLRSAIQQYMQSYPEEEQAEIAARVDGDFSVVPRSIIKSEVRKQFERQIKA